MTDTHSDPAAPAAPTIHPTSGTLERWTGPTLVVAGVVLAAGSLLQGLTDPGDGPAEVAFAQTGTHLTVAVLSLLGFVLIGLSVVLLQVRQRGGAASTGAALLAFLFCVLAAGAEFTDAFVDPTVAQVAPTLFGGDSPPPLVAIGFGVTFVGLALFVGVYGIVLAVMGRVARIGAILVAVGALATGAPGDESSWFALLVAVGLVWIGVVPVRHTRAVPAGAAGAAAPAASTA